MKITEGERRLPRIGSEVRFDDGARVGKIKALNGEGFVVVKGKTRVRRREFPYSAISGIQDRLVTVRNNQGKSLKSKEAKDGISKREFLEEIDGRLELDNIDRTERVARTTLGLMGMRLSKDHKRQLKSILPSGVRCLWTTVDQPGIEFFQMSDFLLPIKKQGRFQSMEEAYIAAREVFSSIKKMLPADEMTQISHSIPRGMQEIWESAS